jgi:hypothetical protein
VARYRVFALVGAVALAAASLAGCRASSSASTPKDIQSALTATANQQGLQLAFSISGSTTAFNGQNSGLSEAQEQAILDSSLSLTVHAARGSNLDNAGNGGELSLTLNHTGSNNPLAEVRVVSPTAYARVDFQQLTTTYHLDKGRVGKAQSELTHLGGQVAGLTELSNGQWVSISLDTLNTLLETANITLPSAPQLVGRVVGAFFNFLAEHATISDIHSNQAQLTVSARSLVTAVVQAVAGTPGVSSLGRVGDLAQRAGNAVPASATARMTVTVAKGIVSGLDLSLNQFNFTNPPSSPVSLKLAVSKSGAVSEPSPVTPINLGQLIRSLEGSSSNS